jgi:hypothetical protein
MEQQCINTVTMNSVNHYDLRMAASSFANILTGE